MPQQDKPPAILYAAKSTKDEKGSIPTQLAQAGAFAESEGRSIAARFADENQSAYHGNRGPELQAALELAEQLDAEIYVQHSDRLARGDGVKARHLVQLVLEAKGRGIRLRSVEDDTSLDSVLMAAAMGERNTEDSRRKGAAVRAGMERKRKRGEYIGHRPYGYAWERNEEDRRVIVPHPQEAPIVRRIFAEYLAGKSQLGIARELSREIVPTHRGGKRWYPGTVRDILARPLYGGWISDGGDGVMEGIHDPLVERSEWEEVAKLRQAKARSHGRGRPVAGNHLFRKGFLRCGECGGAMIPRTVRNRANPPTETYGCFTRNQDLEACSQEPVKRIDVDLAVLRYFEQVGLDLDATREQLRGAIDRKAEETRAMLQTARVEANAAAEKITRVKRDYLDGALTAAEWRDLRAELEPQQAAANAALDRLAQQLEGHEAEDALDEVERQLTDLLASVRAAVEGKEGKEASSQAVSAGLLRLFDSFTFHSGVPAVANVELIDTECWIEPAIRAGDGDKARLGAENNCLEGFTT
ncbi:MAG TPA: recombinase family protein [Solirubrobacterales bacterium]|nr:recombinase family protein [Solirubrobacterales bacterium]